MPRREIKSGRNRARLVSIRKLVGTRRPDLLHGSKQADKVFGLGAGDQLYVLAGNDLIIGGPGKDKM
jgi:Ca2+-binding RTX toxin-like protein